MDEAWEAVLRNDLAAAEKYGRRAVDAGPMNPRLWLDHGRILLQCEERDEAEAAFRQAIALAPTFADAFTALADLQAQAGKLVQAERLQARAVELAPDDAEANNRLESYRCLLPPSGAGPTADAREPPKTTTLTDRFDWDAIAAALRAHGMAPLRGLLSAAECGELAALWDDEERFEHSVRYDSESEGRVAYRFFAPPLPPLITALRSEIYGRAAIICNEWNVMLGRPERFPATLEDFLARCRDAGQYRSTPILLRYEAGGFNAPHRDIAGKLWFPLQLAVTLGPGCSDDGGGGELLLVDQRPGKRVRQRALPTSVGDGVLFCTRERLVEVAGAVGLQGVQHAVAPVRRPRLAVGIPFHEHG